jgi:multidrug efflux pump subunit AcrA (membrane-fusion protein)
LSLLGLFACKSKTEQTQPSLENITESVYAPGVIKSKNQYEVHATVSGLLKQMLVDEGSLVKKGDPLFVISNETSRLSTENARLAAEYAMLDAQDDRLNELRVNIDLARQKMRSDSALLARQRGLWAQQIGSKVELELKELAFSSSKTAYESSVFRYNELRKQLRLAAAQSQKNLSISKTMEGDYTVRSRADGRVYRVMIDNGEIVTPQVPLAVIGDASDYYLELQVDEYDIVRMKTGQKIFVSLDSYKGQSFEATVDKINPIMDERSRTFVVEASFTKKPEVLYPNLTAEANIMIQSKSQALTIPRAFLVQDSFVLLKNNEKRRVQTGLKDYRKIEILSGITENDIIFKPAK